MIVKVKSLSLMFDVRLLATPWTASPLGSSVHGIFQARVLEWGAIASSTRDTIKSHLAISDSFHASNPYFHLSTRNLTFNIA